MKNISLILIVTTIISCNNSAEQAANRKSIDISAASPADSNIAIKEIDSVTGCYRKINGRDTAIVMLEQSGSKITGHMIYDNYQKDGSRGVITGIDDGEILRLYYDFNSEGMRSIMEVYFKKVPGGLLRGTGAMNVKSDTTYFTSGINYSDKEAFSKVDCDKIEDMFSDGLRN